MIKLKIRSNSFFFNPIYFFRKFFVGQISSRRKRETRLASPFAPIPFSFERGCACLLGRHGVPPLRSWGQSISNLTFLPTNDLVHRRIYEPPLFLPFSIALVRSRFKRSHVSTGDSTGDFFFFFRKLSCRRHWNFFFTQQSDFCQHSRKEYFVKVERLCLFFEIFNFNFNFWGYVARHRLKENIVTSGTV